MFSITVITLSAKGCTKRGRTKTGSSSGNTFVINAPSNLTATVISYSRIDLFWQDNSNNEDGFEIYRSQNGTDYLLLTTVYSNITSYIDNNVFIGDIYDYRVRAFNTVGDRSEWSNEVRMMALLGLLISWTDIAVGSYHTLALTTNNVVWSWGANNAGQLGLGDTTATNRYTPSLIEFDINWNAFDNISAVSAGLYYSIALKTNGTIWTWGANGAGQLGLGDTYSSDAPSPMGTDSDWSSMGSGNAHTIALKSAGTLWSWGSNEYGQLGLGDTDNRYRPNQLGGIPNPHPALTATLNSISQIDLFWSDTDNETGFQLFRAITDPPYTLLATFNANITSYSDMTVISNTAYSYRVQALNNVGETFSQPLPFLSVITIGNYTSVSSFPTANLDSDWTRVAIGSYHTIGLKGTGTLWAWGDNWCGQLGDGTSGNGVYRITPRQIGTESDWVSVDAGEYHTIGLKSAGTLWAWGYNEFGQLGDGTYNTRTTPRQIGIESDWFSVTAGSVHTIGLKSAGTLWVWGRNNFGQLGDGTQTDRYTPRQIGTESDWISVAAGYGHTIGLKSAGTLWAWGRNNYGQLGLGITIDRDIPCPLGGPATPLPLIAIPLGLSQIVLTWTDRANNEAGFIIERGITNTDYSPLATVGSNTTSYLDTGLNPVNTYYYRIYAYNNFGNSLYSTVSANFNQIAPSFLILTMFGLSQIKLSWQDNSNDETGFKIERKLMRSGDYIDIATASSNTVSWLDPTPISPGVYYYYRVRAYNEFGDSLYSNEVYSAISGNWGQIGVGYLHTIGLKSTGTFWAWGYNYFSQLGDGTVIDRYAPSQIGTESDWFAVSVTGTNLSTVAAGKYHTIGLKSAGTLWAWGYNGWGQLGDGTYDTRTTPKQIGTESDWVFVTTGDIYTIGLKSAGTLWAWGYNEFGQLGDGTYDTRITPRQIGTESDWLVIAAGYYHTVGLKSAGTLWAWGYNGSGQLGDGTLTDRYTPRQIGTKSDWVFVAVGEAHTIGVKSAGTLWAWGDNSCGQLGDGTYNTRTTPKQIGTKSDWFSVTTGDIHTIGLKSAGTLWAWGANYYGQLGDGTYNMRTTPRQIGAASDWMKIAARASYTIGFKSNATFWGWGNNNYGQLGLGDTIDRNVPTLIGE